MFNGITSVALNAVKGIVEPIVNDLQQGHDAKALGRTVGQGLLLFGPAILKSLRSGEAVAELAEGTKRG